MLRCSGIYYTFSRKTVLDNIHFSTMKTGIVGILGCNGSGKSTLLKILSGLLSCQKGTIEFDGKNILDTGRRLNCATKMVTGALLQESSSDERLSVLENMQFFAHLMKLVAPNERIRELIKVANLSSEIDTVLKKLSGGMRRRCELYRTFLHKPQLLFLDEPTTGLDYQECSRFFTYLRAYVEKHKALALFSSHNPDDFALCDYLLMMHEGKIIAADTPRNFLDQCSDSLLEVEYKSGVLIDPKSNPLLALKQAKMVDTKLEAWLNPQELDKCLHSNVLRSPVIKAFSIRSAHMVDLYEHVLRDRIHG